jgi:choline dehydrogenase-like flavoprotein
LSDEFIQENLIKFHSSSQRSGVYSAFDAVQAFISSSQAKGIIKVCLEIILFLLKFKLYYITAEGKGDWPDIQFALYDTLLAHNNAKFTLLVLNVRPKSVGELVFNTDAYLRGDTDPTLLINPDFRHFSVESDFDVFIEGLNLAMKIMTKSQAFHGMNLTLDPKSIPETCKQFEQFGDEFWKCFISRAGRSDKHYAGTCKMGRENDPLAVVDSKFR